LIVVACRPLNNNDQRSTINDQPTINMLIRTGDTVEVIAGNGRGERSRVIKVNRDTGKAIVEGINRVYKHIRRSQKYPQGGRLSKEMPVQLSNLKYFCSSCGAASRLGARYLADGSKERYCKSCGVSAGQTAPPKTAYANAATGKPTKPAKATAKKK
jgi:large subunit ribosomal protein L24